jgi:hypothetical protein
MPTTDTRRKARGLEVLLMDDNAGAYVPNAFRTQTHVKRSQIERFRQLRELRYPTRNGYGDPLCVSLVLDLLVRLKPHQTIRTLTLVPMLRKEYDHIVWDSQTVGRILHNLCVAAKEAQEKTHESAPYMTADHDYLGNYFLIRPDRVAHQWLLDLLDKVGASAEETIATISTTGKDPTLRAADPITMAMAA